MSEPQPDVVDAYLTAELLDEDPTLLDTLGANAEGGLPNIDVSPLQGKLLQLLVRICGARRVLEIGTLGGYSALWLARGLPADGRLITLEIDPRHAEVARANLDRSDVGDRVEVRVGPALDTLPTLAGSGAFDLVFIDADKTNNPYYLDWAIRLGRPGTLIVCDNVVRGGHVVEPGNADPSVVGTRELLHRLGKDPRLDTTALQTVGAKGWDGFALALVLSTDQERPV